MSEREKKPKLKEYKKQAKVIEDTLSDTISIAEAKLLLHTLIFHFDGFARQQQIINVYMSSKYHWGNKRTARVLEKLAEIGVIDRSRSGPDNWTLFFLVKGFIEKCKERIEQAMLAIKKRLNYCRLAILLITRRREACSRT